MAAIAQAQRQQSLTEVQSLNMMRNGIRTAVSSIAYLRNLFEEEAFEDKLVGDLPLKILQPRNHESELVLSWLDKGVYDALEKKYLRLLLLGIHGDNDELIESYHFYFSYGDEGTTTLNMTARQRGNKQRHSNPVCSKNSAKEQTMMLLRSLIVITQDLGPLPESRYVSMRMWYYDDRVPAEYQPTMFREPSTEEAKPLQFRDVPAEVDVGTVNSGYHSLQIQLRTSADAPSSDVDTSSPMSDKLPETLDQHRRVTENSDIYDQAVELCRLRASVKQGDLRDALGLASNKAVKPICDELIQRGVLLPYLPRAKGYPVNPTFAQSGKNSTSGRVKRIREC